MFFGSIVCMVLTNKQLQKTLGELDWIKAFYKEHFAVKKKPFPSGYDEKLRSELRAVMERINTDVDKAAEPLVVSDKGPGAPAKDRILLTKLLLIQVLFEFTNREMECFSLIFLLKGVDYYSYKSIERAYEDPIVAMILHNLFVLSAGEPRKVNGSGDGTGIALSVTKYYRKEREEDLKEEKETSKRKGFLFSVALLDLDTNLYIGYAAGFKCEQKLFDEALSIAKKAGFDFQSMTLDKLYSYQSIFSKFSKTTTVFVLPKKNATIRGPKEWKELLKRLITDPFGFLRQHYRREKSEANFSRDKRRFGIIRQRIPERQITTALTRAILHNFSMKHLYG